jgi:hypothetical protein
VDNIEATNVLLAMDDNSRTTHIATAGDDNNVTSIKMDEVSNFVLLNIELDGVVRLDGRVRVADGAAIVGNDVRDTTVTDGDLADLAELVGGLLWSNLVDCKAALHVIKKTEMLSRLLNRDDI